MTRRTFFAGAIAAVPVASFELDEIEIADLGKGLGEGRWTSRKLVELYVARIEAIDRSARACGP